MEPLELVFDVACSPQHAFDTWALEITFSGSERGTTVRIVHSGWERLGAEGSDLRDRNRAGWDGLLPRFVEACEGALA
jgi:hypothetical protein